MSTQDDDALTPHITLPVTKKERPSPWIVGGIIVMLLLAVLSTTAGKQWVHRMRYEGATAPEVHLPQARTPVAEGGAVSLSEYRGKVMLLDFWATWCKPCRQQLPIIEALARDAALMDSLQVVTINIDDHAPDRVANVEAYLKMKGMHSTTLLDDGSAQKAYKIQSIPTLVIVDRHGAVFKILHGIHDDSTLRDAIAEAATH